MILTIDPGLGGTGWALLPQVGEPIAHGVFKATKGHWADRATDLADALAEMLRDRCFCDDDECYMEFPELFPGSAVSYAATQQGDLFKLVYLIGKLSRVVTSFSGKEPKLILPRSWKGQLPKDVVIRRIRALWPDCKATSHDADAVGMGMMIQKGGVRCL
jgi:hypothetical protein